jgi:uncharacterized protein YukE
MLGTFTVEPGELERAAAALQTQAGASLAAKQALESLRLERGDFGYIPGMGNKCWGAYSEHVDSCGTALQQLSTSLSNLSAATADTATDYRRTEERGLTFLQQLAAILDED